MTEKMCLPFLKKYSGEEMKQAFYNRRLTAFIQNEIYNQDKKAIEKEWKLGTLHREWDNLLQKKRIRVLAPRDHLKTFYFSVCYSILKASQNGDIEIYIFSKTGKQAVKILKQIKKIVQNTPKLKWLSEGVLVDFWTKSEVCFSNGTTIYAQGYGS